MCSAGMPTEIPSGRQAMAYHCLWSSSLARPHLWPCVPVARVKGNKGQIMTPHVKPMKYIVQCTVITDKPVEFQLWHINGQWRQQFYTGHDILSLTSPKSKLAFLFGAMTKHLATIHGKCKTILRTQKVNTTEMANQYQTQPNSKPKWEKLTCTTRFRDPKGRN